MDKYMPIIKQASLFRNVEEADIRSILHCIEARTSHYRRGACILPFGRQVEALGLVLSGGILIVQEDFWGNRNLLGRFAPGQIFAEAYACTPQAVMNAAVLSETDSMVMWLNIKRILTLCPMACGHHSRMIHNLLGDLAEKNLMLSEKATHMGQRTTRAKLLSYLSAESRRQGAGEFHIPFNRQQLADYLSVERSAMCAELSKLRRQGLLEYEKNRFRLLCGTEPHNV